MKYSHIKGFTLIEMVVVIGIFGVVSAIVLFNYNQFRSNTILTNMAYEVALSVREAQIYGVSVRGSAGNSPSFSKPYGIYIPNGETNQYLLFADDGDNAYSGTTCETPGTDTCVTPYALLGNNKFEEVQVEINNQCEIPAGGLNIIFKRPNPEPFINGDSRISRAQIKLSSPDGTSRYVLVANNGQISVSNEPICQ
jgi:prepilin-type N-terminal cleavage/methylation domain-containing protein